MQRKGTLTNTLLSNKASISSISGIIFITNYFNVSKYLPVFFFLLKKYSYMVFDPHLTEDFLKIFMSQTF